MKHWRLRKALRDPMRWVDADMQRDEWLLLARSYGAYALAIAFAATMVAVLVGMMLR